ncbi:hypothetical protein PFHG_03302 [Plasmodium falciparum HB3]|uniref:glutaminase n=1 Tax=Plasmodium falciparum (isolate HB3) TaxID=137071 RepID=A0A0L7KEK3_PLAFX|nr:hypothetical protein PFHG_03302 [Plasmodium falciparum HB3]
MSEITIGVLSLQGDFEPHINHFIKLQIPSLNIIQVRNVHDLGLCDGLVIPGGESTTVRRCCAYENDTLYNNVENIKLYSNFGNKFSFGGLDITICRNFYGSQNDSFICSLNIISDSSAFKKDLTAACIRAPYIREILSDEVKVLATFSHESYGPNIIAGKEFFDNTPKFFFS